MWIPRRDSSALEGNGGEGEGGYLASASDLLIGLLFVFIILVVVLALEQRRQAVAMKALGDPRGQVTLAIGKRLQTLLTNVEIDPASGVIHLPEDVLFELGRAQLTDRGRSALQASAKELTDVLPCFVASERASRPCRENPAGHTIETVFIEGHTDNRPLLRPGYDNTNLSLDRARSVHQALVQDTALEKYKNEAGQSLFSFAAYADARPRQGTDPADAKNRRVDLRIVLTYRPLETLLPGTGTTSLLDKSK
ncbi:OmpA/MotB family protein [Roseateles toxinivorans]|uniref:OmpA family protein n=1 Tax=Roseateles toxinivorans TaxID=270368 RepID=A0A4R6QT50_9BURK|nr:OmpA family protein [Roseateles toxinivorans]TDP74734.1 OmpA family protein [Roseateles toxinivorans]